MTKSKLISGKVFRLFCMFIPVLLVLIMPVQQISAEDKEYSVKGAEFEVDFEENGSAVISESWDVSYVQGDFTRFYKDINDPLNQLEYYEDIEVLSCSIDGKEAQWQDSTDRVDNHYTLIKNSSPVAHEMDWFLAVSNRTVNYQVKYRIKDAVRLNENNEAVFAYRFIGENFSQPVLYVSVKVNTPEKDAVTGTSFTSGEDYFEGNTLLVKTENNNGLYKCEINMKPEYFSSLKKTDEVVIPKKLIKAEKEMNGEITIFDCVFCGALFLGFIVLVILSFIKGGGSSSDSYDSDRSRSFGSSSSSGSSCSGCGGGGAD